MADSSAMETAEKPRRSTRISARPQPNDDSSEGKKTKASTRPKRGTDEAAGGVPKKAKPENTESAEDNDGERVKIDIGDSLPSFILKNEKDEDIDTAALASDKGVVLFLVPKADTPGCTTQACGFRDSYPNFEAVDFDVYCVSADTPAAQSKWQSKKNLPYPLLSDPKRAFISALGAGEGGKTQRSHFIFAKGGKLVEKRQPVKPADSPKLALEFIQNLVGATSND